MPTFSLEPQAGIPGNMKHEQAAPRPCARASTIWLKLEEGNGINEKQDDSEEARAERARRLREEIANLTSGTPKKKSPSKKKSIREQVDEASRKRK